MHAGNIYWADTIKIWDSCLISRGYLDLPLLQHWLPKPKTFHSTFEPLIVLGLSEPMKSVHCRQIILARVHWKNSIMLWIYSSSLYFLSRIQEVFGTCDPSQRRATRIFAAWGLSSTGRSGIRSPVVVQNFSYSMKATSTFTAYSRSVFQLYTWLNSLSILSGALWDAWTWFVTVHQYHPRYCICVSRYCYTEQFSQKNNIDNCFRCSVQGEVLHCATRSGQLGTICAEKAWRNSLPALRTRWSVG